MSAAQLTQLTLPGPAVTRWVSWRELDVWLSREGWVGQPYDGGTLWSHPTLSRRRGDHVHTGGADPSSKAELTAFYRVEFERLARLYGCSPGELLSRVSDVA